MYKSCTLRGQQSQSKISTSSRFIALGWSVAPLLRSQLVIIAISALGFCKTPVQLDALITRRRQHSRAILAKPCKSGSNNEIGKEKAASTQRYWAKLDEPPMARSRQPSKKCRIRAVVCGILPTQVVSSQESP